MQYTKQSNAAHSAQAEFYAEISISTSTLTSPRPIRRGRLGLIKIGVEMGNECVGEEKARLESAFTEM
jgi:hypothetical protein